MVPALILTLATASTADVIVSAQPPQRDQTRAGVVRLLASQLEQTVGWPWDSPKGRAAHNTGGVIANALVEARAYEDHPAIWITLSQYAAHLERYYADRQAPHMADVLFLAQVDDEKIAPRGFARARALFDRVEASAPTGRAQHARIAKIRRNTPELVGYDVALTLLAALAVGERGYANDLAEATLAGLGPAFFASPARDDSFAMTSLGALTRALTRLDAERYRTTIAAGVAALERAQSDNGSWAINNAQATAHALAALREAGVNDGASARAERWLAEHQRSGAWHSYDDGLPISRGPFIPLVQAEVLGAMLLARGF